MVAKVVFSYLESLRAMLCKSSRLYPKTRSLHQRGQILLETLFIVVFLTFVFTMVQKIQSLQSEKMEKNQLSKRNFKKEVYGYRIN